MIKVQIFGRETLTIENIVFDFNGTIAVDGQIPKKIREKLIELSQMVNIYVATADTYGNAKKQCDMFGLDVMLLTKGETRIAKREFVKKLGYEHTVSLGNGYNDEEMLENTKLSIGILSEEGIYAPLLAKCDVVVNSIENAIDLFLKPNRLVAILRD
ncbi:ATPase P [Sedimentibacter sp. zth1]|uniref:HAD family hydrolase n=1 Tax=Sedimentibacter sp. zth1 TaxID=2816908 RepID=UPI001A9353E2|nr:ATPase P [Sedimentibacter sp. zth1]QSX06066.1 ATPase P [Sedimentibacter sp. zth1]